MACLAVYQWGAGQAFLALALQCSLYYPGRRKTLRIRYNQARVFGPTIRSVSDLVDADADPVPSFQT